MRTLPSRHPGSGRVLLSEVSFEVQAGQALGIIGPSGGGKSTLVRALTGIWPVLRGSVRLDDAEAAQWDEKELGRFMGYLPQEYVLLDTTTQNIARLEEHADPRRIIEAGRAADVHEMIVRLPDGYHTELGPSGTALSGGPAAEARPGGALYGEAFLVVLDEPNSNLDGGVPNEAEGAPRVLVISGGKQHQDLSRKNLDGRQADESGPASFGVHAGGGYGKQQVVSPVFQPADYIAAQANENGPPGAGASSFPAESGSTSGGGAGHSSEETPGENQPAVPGTSPPMACPLRSGPP